MRPHYSILTPPASEPVSYDEAADQLHVDSDADVQHINALIPVAREWVESLTGRASMETTYKLTARTWCDIMPESWSSEIPLRRSPLVSVTSVKYIASGDTALTTLDTADYYVLTGTEPGAVQLATGIRPSLADRADAIQITFIAGNDDSSLVSPMFRHAIKMLVANLYEQRTPLAPVNMQEIPWTLRGIIDNLKLGGYVA